MASDKFFSTKLSSDEKISVEYGSNYFESQIDRKATTSFKPNRRVFDSLNELEVKQEVPLSSKPAPKKQPNQFLRGETYYADLEKRDFFALNLDGLYYSYFTECTTPKIRVLFTVYEIGIDVVLFSVMNGGGHKVNVCFNDISRSGIEFVRMSSDDYKKYISDEKKKKEEELKKLLFEDNTPLTRKDFSKRRTPYDIRYIPIKQGVLDTSTGKFIEYTSGVCSDTCDLYHFSKTNEDIIVHIPLDFLFILGYSKNEFEQYIYYLNKLDICEEVNFSYLSDKKLFQDLYEGAYSGTPVLQNDSFISVTISGENEKANYFMLLLVTAITNSTYSNIPGTMMQIIETLGFDVFAAYKYALFFTQDTRIVFQNKINVITKTVSTIKVLNPFSRFSRLENLLSINSYKEINIPYFIFDLKLYDKLEIKTFDVKNAQKQLETIKSLFYE